MTRKVRSPIQVRVRGTDKSRVLEDLSRFQPESFARWLMWSRRYCGARIVKAFDNEETELKLDSLIDSEDVKYVA